MPATDPEFWKGKRVLVTGHTGFKGAWLTQWLARMGASVTGVSLPPHTDPNLFSLARVQDLCVTRLHDIRDADALKSIVRAARPQIILHLAAQSLVRRSYREPLATFETNVGGTANLLEAMRGIEGLRVGVMVTTDKVYKNLDQRLPFRESDPLGGHDPYSASKAACEIVIASYRDAFLKAKEIAVASVRAGNVIGGGDWSEDRLLPDLVRAWQDGHAAHIRRPAARRPWQHVLEPLGGYLRLAQTLWERPELADAYNFGPHPEDVLSVRAVVEHARAAYGVGDVLWGDGTDGPHEAHWLALSIDKAHDLLGFEPRWDAAEAIGRSMTWFRAQRAGEDARRLCERDIDSFRTAA